ncbi:MAG: glycosyltransferase [Candidatus Cloacimonetes bacterium]|nr:glycosyltransferase [Candidatus Cloacimonadota bacterium]
MINILSTWQTLFAFEIILFSSYTLLMYIYSRKKEEMSKSNHLPTVTLIIPMYNEEKVIKEKIENTAKLDYPQEKLKIIFLDDHSTDKSNIISSESIKQTSLNASVIENQGGKGKARALNWIFPLLESEITIISDADALLKENSLLQLTKNFADPDIGGATGKIIILSDKVRQSQSQEESYRFFFDVWRLGESKIQSVSVCNGPLMGFRTDLLKKIKIDPDAYADDSDMLFKIIRLGYRVVYESKAIVYERVPLSVKGRIIQKMKRINGLRRVYLDNLDMLGKGHFGKIIYPYALLTHIISPIIVLFLVLVYPFIVLQNLWYLGFIIPLIIPKIGKTLLSFMITQFIMNFSFLIPTAGSWEAVEDARYSINQDI